VIYVDGEPLTHMRGGRLVPADERHLRKMRSKIGMCFQHFNLFPHMTALENCMEGPVQCWACRSRRRANAPRTAGDGRHDRQEATSTPRAFRRAAAARGHRRALAMRPKVMLFDEVTSALDPEVIGEVTNVIRKLVPNTT
jgi:polar amino acid transport system ATP-binding protein